MSDEKRGPRPVRVCVGCHKPKEIYFHQPTAESPDGDENKPMCQNCRKKFKASGPGAFKLSKLKGCVAALAGLETLKSYLDEDQQEPLLTCTDYINGLLSEFSTEKPEAEVPAPDSKREDFEEYAADREELPLEELRPGTYFVRNQVLHNYTRISKAGKKMVRRWSGSKWGTDSEFKGELKVLSLSFEQAQKHFPGVTEAPSEAPKAAKPAPPTKAEAEAKAEELKKVMSGGDGV
jgi:hypothetical protein